MRPKLYIFKTNDQAMIAHTYRLLRHILKRYVVDHPSDADYILVSICDIDEIDHLQRAREYKKPVIAGGLIADYPLVNELADYTWHGEIYGFRDSLDKGMTLDEMPCITTKSRKDLLVDQRINWPENPLIRVGKRAMYYYTAKGCPLKCKYCLIGNVRDYQTVPEPIFKKVLKTAGPRLMPVAAYNPYEIPARAKVGETLIKKYIKERKLQKDAALMIRSGVEFVTPELSKSLAKGVTIDELNQAIIRAGLENTKLILYFITGLENQDALNDFFSRLTLDYRCTPPVTLVFTYLEPQPYTPLHDLDIRDRIINISRDRIYEIATQRNKRIRTIPLASPERSILRTYLYRAQSREDYNFIQSVKKKKYWEILDACENQAPHLMGSKKIDEILSRPRKRTCPAYWDTFKVYSPSGKVKNG